MSVISKQTVSILYSEGKSMAEIAQSVGCSIHKIAYWMNKYQIPRRSLSDAMYRKENPNGDPFHIKSNLTPKERQLFGVGIGLFWGEGTKATKHAVRLTNTDPAMLRVFRAFLTQICGVTLEKIRYSIVTFNDTNPTDAKTFWAKELGISENGFGTIVIVPPQGKGSYKKKSLYGVCSMTVSNIKLKAWITNKLEEIK